MARGRKREIQAAQQEREREREQELHRMNLNGQSPMESAEEVYQSMLKDIAETDLQEGSKDLMRNLLTRDFVLANLTAAELNEFKWKLRAKREMFYAMHPSQDCLVVGSTRAAINDDPDDTLRPIGAMKKWQVDAVFDGIWMRVTRSLNMRQQEMLNTNIRESRVDRGEEQQKGGIMGKIRG